MLCDELSLRDLHLQTLLILTQCEYRCLQKKSPSALFLDPEKTKVWVWEIRKVLNPDLGQRGRFWNIDGHELDNLIAKWLEKDSICTNSARRIQICAPKNHLDGCLSKSRKPRKYLVKQKKYAESPEDLEAEHGKKSKKAKFKPVCQKCRQGPN